MRRRILVALATVAALPALLALTAGPAVAADIEYDCNPSSSTWDLKGAWGDGTVLEARTCLHSDSLGDVRAYSYWRTRRGTTAIQSDWNLGGSNAIMQGWVYSGTTQHEYGVKETQYWNDIFDTSIVRLANFPDCSTVAGSKRYQGFFHGVQANPNGATNGASGWKDSFSLEANDTFLNCGT